MTSDTTPSGEVKASSYYLGNHPWRAFDRTLTSRWLASGTTGWLQYQFSSPVAISKYTLLVAYTTNVAPKNWQFLASNDEINWVVLDQRENVTDWVLDTKKEFIITPNNFTNYLYYRINITQNNGGANYVEIDEMEMMGLTAVDASIIIPNPNATVPKNTDYQFDFEINAPVVLGEITIAEQMSQSPLGSGTMFSAPIDKNKWQNISKIEVV